MEKTIYNIGLHESLYVMEENVMVLRVASGWLYKYYKSVYSEKLGYDEDVCEQIVFVPFDNAFQKRE